MTKFEKEAEKILIKNSSDFNEFNEASLRIILDQLLQLHIQGVREIIGKDDEPGLTNDPYGNRNQLRREQRQILEGLQPKE